MDPFELLQVAPRFDLDLAALEATHRELSRVLHPDRYVSAPPRERREALGRAISVNEAWRRLKEPVTRAEALFDRYGVAYGERAEPKATPEWLFEVMELREALSEARRARDLARVERLMSEVKTSREATLARLTAGFLALAQGEASDQEALLRELGKLRYFRRFLDEAGATLDELS